MRIASLAKECGILFPWEELSSDPFEQWLIAEAVMARYMEEKQEAEKLERGRADAQAKAKAMLGVTS